MEQMEFTRSERFLKLYRVLEGLLDKRYSGRREGSSVVMEYLHDDDSEPYRQQLDLCREIRNLLTHTSDERGEPVVEPSESVLEALETIVRHVSMPRYAVDFGTPAERILCASPNDSALDVMRRMRKMGFSASAASSAFWKKTGWTRWSRATASASSRTSCRRRSTPRKNICSCPRTRRFCRCARNSKTAARGTAD